MLQFIQPDTGMFVRGDVAVIEADSDAEVGEIRCSFGCVRGGEGEIPVVGVKPGKDMMRVEFGEAVGDVDECVVAVGEVF